MAYGSANVPGRFVGNAGTATKLKTARKIGDASFDGSADITLAQMGAAATGHTHAAQTSVTGNAGTATKLATARKIGDASFDGSADITLAQMGAAATGHTHTPEAISAAKADHTHTAQTSVTGNAGTATKLKTARKIGDASFDGSADITLAQMGAAATGHTHTPEAIGAAKADHTHTAQTTVTGNAGTATKLKTARTIKVNLSSTTAESFDGSADITPGVSGILGTANGGLGNNSGYVRAGKRSGSTIGDGATAEGKVNTASGEASHAEGTENRATGLNSHAEGYQTEATGTNSHTGGYATIASAHSQTAIGTANVECSDKTDGLFIIGKGSYNTSTETLNRANAFRVKYAGVAASGSYSSTGADYAELFEWEDGNPGKEDRAGRFVALDGEKIRLAGPGDDFILGIISGNPSVVGDVHDDQWQGMFLYDIFGRPIWEDVEVPAETVEEPDPEHPENMITRIIVPAHTERRQKFNPDYDSSQRYIPRSERSEWGCVGMMGKLVVVDDGTCEVNGWCKSRENGVATASAGRTDFRVMARLDDTHVRVLMLGR